MEEFLGNESTMESNVEKVVNDQYENYPYPERNPIDERKQLFSTFMDDLEVVNSICLKGIADFKKFKVLVAGGGTGDAVIYLAEQLRKFSGANIVYCDLSSASMEIAQQRALERKLDNITWINKSLLDLDEYAESFDFISCCGVLHHLEDPAAGLNCLKRLLRPSGAMAIMVYAKIGRTAVYQMQELIKHLAKDKKSLGDKIKLAKNLIKGLPETNWWNHSDSFISDHAHVGEAGIVDLLLHSQDRAYSIKELYEYIEEADLNLVDFAMPQRYALLSESYEIDTEMLQEIEAKSIKEQQAIIELYAGNIIKHIFFVSKVKDTRADVKDNDNVPFFHKIAVDVENLASIVEDNGYRKITLNIGENYKSVIKIGDYTAEILRNINGVNTIGEIVLKVKKRFSDKANSSIIESDFEVLYNALNKYDAMLLRNKDVQTIPTPEVLQNFVSQIYK